MVLFLLYKIPSDAENFVLSDDTLNVSMELSKAVFEILSTLAGKNYHKSSGGNGGYGNGYNNIKPE